MLQPITKKSILYVFGGEKAQGAEIVIERLMGYNAKNVQTHLILSPGKFASDLLSDNKPYRITLFNELKKLNRPGSSKLVFYLKALRNYLVISRKVCKYIRQNNIDIVHANTMVIASYLLPLRLYAYLFIPNVRWIWSDHDLGYFSKIDFIIARYCVRMYHRTLVVSNAVKKKYEQNDDVVILYNGLNPDFFKPDENRRQSFRIRNGFDNHSILIGLPATIARSKGQLELMEAFNKLSDRFPTAIVVLAGGFESGEPDYEIEIRHVLSRNNKIAYIGYEDNMNEFYNGCDIIINNSNGLRSEPLGTTIYEAMACEKLVLATNIGGTPEIITDNIDGLLFAPEKEDELFNRLLYAILKYDQLSHIRFAARQKVVHMFNIKTMGTEYEAIINGLQSR